ncbi:Beta-galactosidase-1-like protein [Polyrhizophydium stewartii]|uniref:Beta-galactosidase-1-like protein n=1 Tax=Polyrhizophydium stewartii TaxID=2732419 RepID=A0ABR4N996_9FUNG|nr:hypothetical protein HK105_000824 [Polyrhizophydium stewartii]
MAIKPDMFPSGPVAKGWILPRDMTAVPSPAAAFFAAFPEPASCTPKDPPRKAAYDSRAFTIDGKRQLIIAGAVHYARSIPAMWPELMRRTKAAGINTIDTPVFWNLHEPERGQYDFSTGSANLPLFLELAHEASLNVALRVGPYIGANWNYGGMPFWLRDSADSKFRMWDSAYMDSMDLFVRVTLQVVEPFLARNGGPIMMMQIEDRFSEFSNGRKWDSSYLKWVADFSSTLGAGVPWFMNNQDDISSLIVGCSDTFCDNWVNDKRQRDKPGMFVDLPSGWPQKVGKAKPIRPAEDVAFAFASFIARGGTYVSYNMWYGGTNFGRSSATGVQTSYDFDAPLDEHGFPHPRKYKHLAEMHKHLVKYAAVILASEPTKIESSGEHEIHSFGDTSTPDSIVFLSNWGKSSIDLSFDGATFNVAAWSVSLLTRDTADNNKWKVIFNTANVTAATSLDFSSPATATVRIQLTNFASHTEAPGIWDASLAITKDGYHAEQLSLTRDKTDCLWYIKEVDNDLQDESGTMYIGNAWNVYYVWVDGVYIRVRDWEWHSGNDGYRYHVREALEQAGKPTSGKHTIQILSCNSGLPSAGTTTYEAEKKGLLGWDYISGQPISEGTWTYQVGTLGENKKVFEPSFVDDNASPFWKASAVDSLPSNAALAWYRSKIPMADVTAQVDVLLSKAAQIDHPILSFALYTGSLGRGQMWVNGHSIGRFNNTAKQDSGCDKCDYWSSQCFVGCGKPSQEYMRVPADWMLANGTADVQIVWFEEQGCDPTKVTLIPLLG